MATEREDHGAWQCEGKSPCHPVSRKSGKRARIKLGFAAIAAALAFVVSYDELSFRMRLDAVLRSLPQRVAHGESLDLLFETRGVLDAHPFALSRGSARALGSSLIEAERISITEAARAHRFAEARRRIVTLASLVDAEEQAAIATLRQSVERRAQVLAGFEAWKHGVGPQRALHFSTDEADQVRRLYPSLGLEGQRGCRARFLELESPSGLAAFVELHLRGVETEALADREVRVLDVIRGLTAQPRTATWKLARDEAYSLVVDAMLTGAAERARQVLPLLAQVPEQVPTTREALHALALPAR